MSNYNISYSQYKNNYYLPQRIGPGSLGNNQVRMCKFCSQNGFYNEPIVFRKISGKWIPFDYYSGQRHQHVYPEANTND